MMDSNSTITGEIYESFSLESLKMLYKNTWNIYVWQCDGF